MNFLGKWGKKIFILGLSSLALDFFFYLIGLSFFEDFGGSYINVSITLLGVFGMFIDNKLNPKVKDNEAKFSLIIAEAILEEKKAKKIKDWDNNTVFEYLNQTLVNNKFSIWVKTREIKIGNEFDIYLNINFTGIDELISPTHEITLKDGKKYTQHKHELAIKKEYSEKVFLCAINLIE